jgi:hypothetical protein
LTGIGEAETQGIRRNERRRPKIAGSIFLKKRRMIGWNGNCLN